MAFCVNCGRELPPGAGFCPKCGAKAEAAVCPKCGKEVDPDDAFCPSCGAPLAPAPEPEPTPEPEPAFQRVARIPETCPRCGKPSLPGYDHCTYCGQAWEVLKVPAVCPSCGAPGEAGSDRCTNCGAPWPREEEPKPEDDPDQARTLGTGEPPREFSWRYQRATMRWSERVSIRAEVDDKRLLCAFKRRMLWHEGETEQEIPLKQISSFKLTPKASVAIWALTMMMLFVIVSPPLLPLLGVDAFVNTGEVAAGMIVSLVVCALMMWWVRFHLYHYHLTIRGQTGITELELDAQGYNDLWQLQTELTRRTGIQPQSSTPEKNGAVGGVIAGVFFGALLALGLVAFVVSQLPETPSAETLADAPAASRTTTTFTTPTPAPTTAFDYDSLYDYDSYDDYDDSYYDYDSDYDYEEDDDYYYDYDSYDDVEYVSGFNEELSVLYGNWEATGYGQALTIENNLSTGQVYVTNDFYATDTHGGTRSSGILSADDEGYLYADLTSTTGGQAKRIYLFYEDNSIYAFWIYEDGTSTDVLQFERRWW